MEYPEEFVKKVKAKLPDSTELHEALDSGSVIVGHYLDGERYFKMGPSTIIAAFERNCEYEVKEAAERTILCEDLCEEWNKLYEEYKKARDI